MFRLIRSVISSQSKKPIFTYTIGDWLEMRLRTNERPMLSMKYFRPNWEEISLIYRTTWDWRNNYSIHLFARFMPYIDKPDRTINELRYLNTTYGEIARFTLYKNATLQTLP